MTREKLPPDIKLERRLAILKRQEEKTPSALDAALIAAKTNKILNLIESRASGSEASASAVFNLTRSRSAAASAKRSR